MAEESQPLQHSEAEELGRSVRAQKGELKEALEELNSENRRLVRLVGSLELQLDQLRLRVGEARRLAEGSLASRSWRLGHRLMRLGRLATGRGRERESALSALVERLAELEVASSLSRPTEPAPGESAMRFVFITGCLRSGTSATIRLLNVDSRFAIGQERFKYLRGRLRKHHFRRDYFLNPAPDETNILQEHLYRRLGERWRTGQVAVVGDKVIPHGSSEVYPGLVREFPDCRLLFLYRDLEGTASSYNRRAADPRDLNWPETHDFRRAVRDWNASLATLRSFVKAGHGDRVFVVRYERLFAGDLAYLREIFDFLGMPTSPQLEAAFAEATKDWESRAALAEELDEEMRLYLGDQVDPLLREWAESLAGPSSHVRSRAES